MTTAAPRITIAPLKEADFPVVRDRAHGIWHAHYDGIVGAVQVDSMLARRCADESLRAYLGAADRWFDVLRVGADSVGYASHALTSDAGVLKLEQLYVAAAQRGRGLGRLLLNHVERHAKALACPTVVLQVNKRNASAMAFYRAAGFVVREAAVFPIGDGFVMDDYVMAKVLA